VCAELPDGRILVITVIARCESVAIPIVVDAIGYAIPIQVGEGGYEIAVAVLVDVIADLGCARIDVCSVVVAVLGNLVTVLVDVSLQAIAVVVLWGRGVLGRARIDRGVAIIAVPQGVVRRSVAGIPVAIGVDAVDAVTVLIPVPFVRPGVLSVWVDNGVTVVAVERYSDAIAIAVDAIDAITVLVDVIVERIGCARIHAWIGGPAVLRVGGAIVIEVIEARCFTTGTGEEYTPEKNGR
jgi:hypothetical protein